MATPIVPTGQTPAQSAATQAATAPVRSLGAVVPGSNPTGLINSPVAPPVSPVTAAKAANGPTYAGAPTQQPATPVTTMSSSTITNDVNPKNVDTIKNITAAPPGNQTDVNSVQRYSNGNFATAPTGATQDPESGLWTANGQHYAVAPSSINGEANTDPYAAAQNDLIEQMKSKASAQLVSTLSGIQNLYGNLIQSQKQINASSEASTNSLLTMGGSFRNSSGAGIAASVASAGLSKISDLIDKENGAINAAQAAYDTGNMALLDKQLTLAKSSHDQQQTEAGKIYDALVKENGEMRDRSQKLQDKLNDNLDSVSTEAAKNGAPKSVLDAIGKAGNTADALTAAGMYVQSSTNPDLNKYLQYKRDALSKGLTPLDYTSFQDQQDQKALKDKVSEASQIAYAQASAKNKADSSFSSSDKNQQKLEQQYRGVLAKEFSSRTGALGVENAKVNQANHLNSLLTQYYDPKTGNYNVPKAQYAELVMGLANMIAPTGTSDVSTRKDLMSMTAKGDLNGALSYLMGTPQNGNTQEMIKNLVDSIDRQASTAASNREAALQNLRDQAPTDLEQSRIDALNKSTKMVEYSGQHRISKTNVDNYLKTHGNDVFGKDATGNPITAAGAISKLYQQPGATDQDIEEYLKANGISL